MVKSISLGSDGFKDSTAEARDASESLVAWRGLVGLEQARRLRQATGSDHPEIVYL